MNTQSEVKPKSLAEEFPGLEAIAQKVFDCSYEDCTPNLRTHVRVIAERDASKHLVAALRGIQALFYPPSPYLIHKLGGMITNADQSAIDNIFISIDAAVQAAEGRILIPEKGGIPK